MRPEEREAVTTTIVGGRPPGCGRDVGAVPRGIEVLVKKAAVDAEFKGLLLEQRSEAATRIGLELNPAEAAMLAAIPAAQLELIIERTEVPEESRRAFLGTVAGAMLAALGLGLTGCGEQEPPAPSLDGVTLGITPDRPPMRPEVTPTAEATPTPTMTPEPTPSPEPAPKPIMITLGIQPDRDYGTRGIRPR